MWTDNAAEAFKSGRFKLQGMVPGRSPALMGEREHRYLSDVFAVHDMFSPQPQKNASVFFLQFIFNFMPDSYAIKILSALRQAATNDTKLLISATVSKYACPDTEIEESTESVAGSSIISAPNSLSAHYMADRQSDYVYMHDIDVSTFRSPMHETSNRAH